LLTAELGWRGACFAYAAIQLAVSLPIYLCLMPREVARPARAHVRPSRKELPAAGRIPRSWQLVGLAAITLTISAVLSATMSVHLLTVLQARGITLAGAVALGALVGPAQVGARFVEMLIAKYHHPIWTKLASVTFVAIGLFVLWAGLPILAIGLVFYGAGIGLESIARGTLPLALFGAEGYATLMGKLAMPSLIAQALAPSAGAMFLQASGTETMLSILVTLAVVNLAAAALLFALISSRKSRGAVE
jgi:hypothetical protein